MASSAKVFPTAVALTHLQPLPPKMSLVGCEPGILIPASSDRFKDETCSGVHSTPEIAPEHVSGISNAQDPCIAHACESCTCVVPNSDYLCNLCHKERPRRQPPSESGHCGVQKPPENKGKCQLFSETPPRGQCLLYNWTEEVTGL